MSAWPEATYVVNKINESLDLSSRVDKLEQGISSDKIDLENIKTESQDQSLNHIDLNTFDQGIIVNDEDNLSTALTKLNNFEQRLLLTLNTQQPNGIAKTIIDKTKEEIESSNSDKILVSSNVGQNWSWNQGYASVISVLDAIGRGSGGQGGHSIDTTIHGGDTETEAWTKFNSFSQLIVDSLIHNGTGTIADRIIQAAQPTDSGWITIDTLASYFKRGYDNSSPVEYRKIGDVVYFRGAISPAQDLVPLGPPGSSNPVPISYRICDLPQGYRPSERCGFVCQSIGSAARWYLTINKDGSVTFSHYADDGGFLTASNSVLTFTVSFPIG